MKSRTIHAWAIPSIIGGFMLFSAYISATRAMELAQLGFPNYFRIELTMAKILGAVMLLIPQSPARLKEWVCVCFGVVLISAAIAKANSGYPALSILEPLLVLVVMIALLAYSASAEKKASDTGSPVRSRPTI